jgi:hypothetical protein
MQLCGQKNVSFPSQARRLLSHLDDDFAFGTSFFDVGHGLFGRFEWKDPIYDGMDGPEVDESRDLAQLISARSHEEK